MDIPKIIKKSKFILRKLGRQDAEDVLQDVFLSLLEKNPDIKCQSYYDIVIRNEMIEFLNKEKNLKKNEKTATKDIPHDIEERLTSDILFKELSNIVRKEFTYSRNDRKNRQLQILNYMLEQEDGRGTIQEMTQELGLGNYDTAKSNVRYVREKIKKCKILLEN